MGRKVKSVSERLRALRKKEAELVLQITLGEHPELKRVFEDMQECIENIDKCVKVLGQELTKAELRKRDTLQKRLDKLLEKKEALLTAIAGLEEQVSSYADSRKDDVKADKANWLKALQKHIEENDAVFEEKEVEIEEIFANLERYIKMMG